MSLCQQSTTIERGEDQGKTWAEKREQRRAEENRSEVTGEIRENGGNNKQGREEKGVSGQGRNTGNTMSGEVERRRGNSVRRARWFRKAG